MGLKEKDKTNLRSWRWPYKKIRAFGFSVPYAFYRSVLYVILGDTGTFKSKRSGTPLRFRR